METSSGKYTNGTASALIKTGNGVVAGIIVNSHTNGTIKLWNNTEASGAVLMNTFTYPAGSGIYSFPAPIYFSTGLYLTVGGTIDYTIIYK